MKLPSNDILTYKWNLLSITGPRYYLAGIGLLLFYGIAAVFVSIMTFFK